jgi:hypothetical protein
MSSSSEIITKVNPETAAGHVYAVSEKNPFAPPRN